MHFSDKSEAAESGRTGHINSETGKQFCASFGFWLDKEAGCFFVAI
jgi:hypothetical protein